MLNSLRERWQRWRLARRGLVPCKLEPPHPLALIGEVANRLHEAGLAQVELTAENLASWIGDETRGLADFDAGRCFAEIVTVLRGCAERKASVRATNANAMTTFTLTGTSTIVARKLSQTETRDLLARQLEEGGVAEDGQAYLRRRRAETAEWRRVRQMEADLDRRLTSEETARAVKPFEPEDYVNI